MEQRKELIPGAVLLNAQKLLKAFVILFAVLFAVNQVTAQHLIPGFDKQEYKELMLVSVQSAADSLYSSKYPKPEHFSMLYQSNPIGLDNSWDLWQDERGVACISIRGTTLKQISWLANFYAAMVPAKGELQLRKNDTFRYQLADNPEASVHAGWLVCMAVLSEEILPKVDSLIASGTKEYLIIGHSQGGAIAYLLTAHLMNLQATGRLSKDTRFKTYCSAAPKPGNLQFAYDYEQKTQFGWSFNVVNPEDWVPETPPSVQTVSDFNSTNPFANVDEVFKKQKFPVRVAMKRIFKKLTKPSFKAQKNYEKYLGGMVDKMIREALPELVVPEYRESSHYVRTGTFVVMQPDANYYTHFPKKSDQVFTHHLHDAYLLLLEGLPN